MSNLDPNIMLMTYDLAQAWYNERLKGRMTEEQMLEAFRHQYQRRYGTEHMEQIIADAHALVEALSAREKR